MTSSNHTARLYAVAATVFVLFVSWAAIAAHPWKSAAAANPKDARLVALAQREQLLRRDMALVQTIAARATASVKAQNTARTLQSHTAAAPVASPSVKVVTLPPLVITRTS
jgi:hypothetical protein